jgi:hypothetical protein
MGYVIAAFLGYLTGCTFCAILCIGLQTCRLARGRPRRNTHGRFPTDQRSDHGETIPRAHGRVERYRTEGRYYRSHAFARGYSYRPGEQAHPSAPTGTFRRISRPGGPGDSQVSKNTRKHPIAPQVKDMGQAGPSPAKVSAQAARDLHDAARAVECAECPWVDARCAWACPLGNPPAGLSTWTRY